MKSFLCPFMICIAAAITASSCGSARRTEPIKGPVQLTNEKIARGKMIFDANCTKCHPNGEAGVGPPVNNIYVPGFVLKYRIRNRSFLLWMGKMPSFKKHEISRKDLYALTAYLKAMRKNG